VPAAIATSAGRGFRRVGFGSPPAVAGVRRAPRLSTTPGGAGPRSSADEGRTGRPQSTLDVVDERQQGGGDPRRDDTPPVVRADLRPSGGIMPRSDGTSPCPSGPAASARTPPSGRSSGGSRRDGRERPTAGASPAGRPLAVPRGPRPRTGRALRPYAGLPPRAPCARRRDEAARAPSPLVARAASNDGRDCDRDALASVHRHEVRRPPPGVTAGGARREHRRAAAVMSDEAPRLAPDVLVERVRMPDLRRNRLPAVRARRPQRRVSLCATGTALDRHVTDCIRAGGATRGATVGPAASAPAHSG
jgi:hypothetical protein